MSGPGSPDLALNRALWAVVNQRFTDAAADEMWRLPEAVWGLFGVPEHDLGVLGDVRGLDVAEVGCGTAYFSAWLVRAGAAVVAVDVSGEQLRTAVRLQRQVGPVFPLVQADGERLPLAGAALDLVVSEHGAGAWCDPERWLPEAARVLRPGGRLVFLTNSHLSALCVPDEGGVAGDRLVRGPREAYRVRWPGGGVWPSGAAAVRGAHPATLNHNHQSRTSAAKAAAAAPTTASSRPRAARASLGGRGARAGLRERSGAVKRGSRSVGPIMPGVGAAPPSAVGVASFVSMASGNASSGLEASSGSGAGSDPPTRMRAGIVSSRFSTSTARPAGRNETKLECDEACVSSRSSDRSTSGRTSSS